MFGRVLLVTFLFDSVLRCGCDCVQVNRTRGICSTLDEVQTDRNRRWTTLDVNGNNPIEKLTPKTLAKLVNLKKLSVKNAINGINVNSLKKTPGLDTLVLVDNSLNRLNYRVFEGTAVKTVYMSNNRLGEFVMADVGLVELGVENEDLDVIADGMFNLKTVEKLALRRNHVSEIEKGGFSGMSRLKWLYLCGNLLKGFGGDVFNDVMLEHLYLNDNQIEELTPEMFTSLPKLKTLYLGQNQIKQVDSSVFEPLADLQELSLAYNQLTRIDTSELPGKLRGINLSFNQFVSFPTEELDRLDLEELSLLGNPMDCPCFLRMRRWMSHRNVEGGECSNDRFRNGQIPVCFSNGRTNCTSRPVVRTDEILSTSVVGVSTPEEFFSALEMYGNVPNCLLIKPHSFITSYYDTNVFE